MQLSFQLTRSPSPEQLGVLRGKYQTLIWGVFSSKEIATSRRYEFMSLIYRLMLHTRDTINGKGECMLSSHDAWGSGSDLAPAVRKDRSVRAWPTSWLTLP